MARKPLTPEQKVQQRKRFAAWYADPDNSGRVRDQAVQWGRANPERRREQNLAWMRAKKYGISSEQVDELRETQDNKCGICGGIFASTPCVDHCHETGKVRGLLCRKCNSGIGQLGDSLSRVEAAAAYLRKHQGNQ